MPPLNSRSQRVMRPDTLDSHARAVQRVIATIRSRLDEDITLEEMAAIAYMSRYHFNRTFRRITGLPPCRFLAKLRVEAATQMLLNTNHRITDICLDVGYSSLGTFIRRFSELLGTSPRRLRTMRRSPSRELLKRLDTEKVSVRGHVEAPPSFSGPIFIGLFHDRIPEGTPVACAINLEPGEYVMRAVPPGRYYLFALGLPHPTRLDDFFRCDAALRGGGQRVVVNNEAVGCAPIALREPALTDPPVLLNLPALLRKREGPGPAIWRK
jgi:AraC family transcriptional regulator